MTRKWQYYLISGASCLGSPKIKAEKSGQKAAEELAKQLEEGHVIDQYAQDQLIIFMALAKGQTQVRWWQNQLDFPDFVSKSLRKLSISIWLWAAQMFWQGIDNNLHRCCTALTFGPPATLG